MIKTFRIFIIILFIFKMPLKAQLQYMPIRVGDKFGVSDLDKNILIEPQFDFINLGYSDWDPNELFLVAINNISDKDKIATFIRYGKIIIRDSSIQKFKVSEDLIKAYSRYNIGHNGNFRLYSNEGKLLSKKYYRTLYTPLSSPHQILLILKREDSSTVVAIYDKVNQSIVKSVDIGVMSGTEDELYKMARRNENELQFFLKQNNHGLSARVVGDNIKLDLIPNDSNITESYMDFMMVENEPIGLRKRPSGVNGVFNIESLDSNLAALYPNDSLSVAEYIRTIKPVAFWNYDVRGVNKISTSWIYPNDMISREYPSIPFFQVQNKQGKSGLYRYQEQKWILEPEYDNIYIECLGTNCISRYLDTLDEKKLHYITTLITEKNDSFSIKEVFQNYLGEVEVYDKSLSTFSGIPVDFERYQWLYDRVLFIYNKDTEEFSHYALYDGPEFIIRE